MLFWGPYADRYGRRQALFGGIGLMAAGSIVCLFAASLGGLDRRSRGAGVRHGHGHRRVAHDRQRPLCRPHGTCARAADGRRGLRERVGAGRRRLPDVLARLALGVRRPDRHGRRGGVARWKYLPETRPTAVAPPGPARDGARRRRPAAPAAVPQLRAAVLGGVLDVRRVHFARAVRDGQCARPFPHRVRSLLPVDLGGLRARQLVDRPLLRVRPASADRISAWACSCSPPS